MCLLLLFSADGSPVARSIVWPIVIVVLHAATVVTVRLRNERDKHLTLVAPQRSHFCAFPFRDRYPTVNNSYAIEHGRYLQPFQVWRNNSNE